ncbi:MAG: CHAT domain-containing protein, partial [Proteobacteria bacterium]|nr:CHAT domain-containing protein [Pseudomonadota bacterium]
MKNIFYFFSLFLIMTALSGCAGNISHYELLLNRGNYLEAENKIEKDLGDIKNSKSGELVFLCQTYYKTKKYDKLFSCLDQLEKNINRGDKYLSDWNLIIAGSRQFPYDLTLIPHILRTEAYLELGNYKRALQSANLAYNLYKNMNWAIWDLQINWDRILKIRILSNLVISNAFYGNREVAKNFLSDLENEGTGFGARYFVDKEKKVALAKSYMAVGSYDKILENNIDPFLTFAHIFTLGIFKAIEENVFAYSELPKKFYRYKALYETGKTEEAKSGYDELINNPQSRHNGEIFWSLLYDRGLIYEKEGNRKTAKDYLEKAINIIESQRSSINTEANKIGFIGNKQRVYEKIISLFYDDKEYINAFEFAERSKSRALVDLLASKKELTSKSKEINSLIAELDNFENQGKSIAVNLSEKTGHSSTRGLEIKEKIKTLAPEVFTLISVSVPSPKEIQSLLKEKETIIEYYYGSNDLYAFVINRDKINAVKLDNGNFLNLAESFRKSLQDPDTKDYLELSKKLYQKIFQPLRSLIESDNIIIVPHGILHYIPFSALYDGEKFLIDKYNLSYLPSASIIRFLRDKKESHNNSSLILGNPDIGNPLYDLKYAEDEAVTISKKLPNPTVLLKNSATETAFKKNASGFRYIHLASHGLFNSDDPLN